MTDDLQREFDAMLREVGRCRWAQLREDARAARKASRELDHEVGVYYRWHQETLRTLEELVRRFGEPGATKG